MSSEHSQMTYRLVHVPASLLSRQSQTPCASERLAADSHKVSCFQWLKHHLPISHVTPQDGCTLPYESIQP